MGEWGGEPTRYVYGWEVDGVAVGSGAASYVIEAGDVGKTATCTVTASNVYGSTEAAVSNAVVVKEGV
jgi:hypothetical protein